MQSNDILSIRKTLDNLGYSNVDRVWISTDNSIWFVNPTQTKYISISNWDRFRPQLEEVDWFPDSLVIVDVPLSQRIKTNHMNTFVRRLKELSRKEIVDLLTKYGFNTDSTHLNQSLRSLIQMQPDLILTKINAQYLPDPARVSYFKETSVPYNPYDERYFADKIIRSHQYRVIDGKRQYPIEVLGNVDINTLANIVTELGYPNFNGDVEDLLSIIWWHYIIHDSVPLPGLSRLSSPLSQEELLPYISSEYDGDISKAGLTFTISNSVKIPRYTPISQERQQMIFSLPFDTVMILARYLYNYFPDEKFFDYYKFATPRNYVASLAPSPLEPYLIANVDNISELGDSLGIVAPNGVNKEQYILDNISKYDKVLTRRDVKPIVTVLKIKNSEEALQQLELYTDKELIDFFELHPNHESREDIITNLAKYITRRIPHWSFRKTKCLNMNELLPATYDTPADIIASNDPNNPIISYGTIAKYNCYSLEELEHNFREDTEFGFRFLKPGDGTKEFSLDDIEKLRHLLRRENNPQLYGNLLNKIEQGLQAKSDVSHRMEELRRDYLQMSHEDQALVREYLVWLFTMGMTMRFWEGPGHEYPYVWSDNTADEEEATDEEQRCDLATRNSNVMNYFLRRTRLLESMSPELEQWIINLPRIMYDSNNLPNIPRAEDEISRINRLIELTQSGLFCMAAASDHLIQTGYYLALSILDLDNNGFNNLVSEILGIPNHPEFLLNEIELTLHDDLDFGDGL
jgi:hypothetical protein